MVKTHVFHELAWMSAFENIGRASFQTDILRVGDGSGFSLKDLSVSRSLGECSE